MTFTITGPDDAEINPAHYKGDIECIDAIEQQCPTQEHFTTFCLMTALAYIWRAQYKGSAAIDVTKAQWYLDRALQSMVKEGEVSTNRAILAELRAEHPEYFKD